MAGQAILGEIVLKDAKPGESAAETIEILVNQHAALVYRLTYAVLRNHHDAEDAAQECFLRVWKWRDRLHQVRNLKTWLARIAWTAALDRRSSRPLFARARDEDATAVSVLESLPDGGLAPDEQLAREQLRQLLEQMIAGLPDDLRQPLELSTVQELNSAEIAEIMEIPENSVRTRLLRARRLLKGKLAARLEVKKYV
jgi:RNA polymerase sigma-70 factor (ECF subfamily)